MANFVRHLPCPKCKSRDNLALYSDQSCFCFGCGFSTPSSVSGFVKEARKDYQQEEEKTWSLPDDLSQDFPEEVVQLIQKYSLTIEELIKYDYYFSKRSGGLWRILDSGDTGRLRGSVRSSCSAAEARPCRSRVQGDRSRSFPKSRFYGSKETVFALSGTEHQSSHLVVVEDGFSSIKVGRVCHALPLFGTHISMSKITALKGYKQVTVWLDHDKFKEAWAIALKFKWLGIKTNVVLTPLDPKMYAEQEILYYLGITNEEKA